MCATYYARTSDHGYETCAEHLAMAGCLAGGFAKGFGYLDDGLLAGLVHDLGKYSDAFQRRIRNPDHCGPVDHSTAGALLLMRYACPLAAMAVAGHHAGLPDFGSYGELEGPTFMSRMNRARRAGDCNPLALAQAGETQLNIPQSAFLHGTRSAKPTTSGKRSERWSLYADMMLTRMLFSALVDADRLDAEFFTSNRIDRAEHHILESLKKHLGPQNLASGRVPAFDALREASLTVSVERDAEDRSQIDRLAAIMENTADGYLAAPDKRPIDIRRCELLERCLDCGKDPSYGTGLYTLTAPTGSGKTISSIAFALEHARTNNLRRVIYVIPYTSIIDQTVGQFEAIFGTDAVLPHYSEAPCERKRMHAQSDYPEDDWLALSGLQHFAFCRRQWALIHIEQQWEDNYLTTAGSLEHDRAHDYSESETRGSLLIMRDLRVFSRRLGITGACDVVEFRQSEAGVPLHGRSGTWLPYPVEYKHGAPKQTDADRLQLCAEAMCLEEMLACAIPEGALFYQQTRHRERVSFDESLRNRIVTMTGEMHDLFARGHTPKVRPSKACRACSLHDVCLPKLVRTRSARQFIEEAVRGEVEIGEKSDHI